MVKLKIENVIGVLNKKESNESKFPHSKNTFLVN